MFLLNSYFSFSKCRFLLLMVLLGCSSLVHAQEEPVVDTARSHIGEQVEGLKDEEVEDEEETEIDSPVPPSLRTVPDSIVSRLKAEKEFEYANDPEYWTEIQKKKKIQEPAPEYEERDRNMFDFSGVFGIVKIVLLVIVIALLGFLVYKLMGNRWPWDQPAKLKEDDAVEEEELNVDELQIKIKEAIAQQKYRLAIRYSYLFTLRRMDEKGWIKLDPKFTNFDYVNQMKQHDPHNTFAYLTNVYDYVWYGEFDLNEEQFNLVYKDFQKYLNTYSH